METQHNNDLAGIVPFLVRVDGKPTFEPLTEPHAMVPLIAIPGCNVEIANQNNVQNNILFATWGGIGDVICAEPTIRYGVNNFKDCNITIATREPELFEHLDVCQIYDLKRERPIEDDHLILHTIPRQEKTNVRNLTPHFLSHMSTNCVDFPALSALRSQLPIKDRYVVLRPPVSEHPVIQEIVKDKQKYVVVHAGRHWQSKTFPTDWWNQVLSVIKEAGYTPVLIGKHDGETQGYVDTDAEGCIDLRDKTTLMDSVWMLQQMPVVVCNDSSPLHMSVTGNAFIFFVASVKHPDYITHYRMPLGHAEPVWSWRMKDLSKDGLWNHISICPNKPQHTLVDEIDEALLRSFLPEPSCFGPLIKEAMYEYFK